MQRNSMDIYTKYRTLLILLLIYPIYKLIDALLHKDYAITLITIITIAVAVIAIIFLERKLKDAQPPRQGMQPKAE